jgi:phosphatidylinositol alpha-1,6-mannosyltransferase
MRDGWLYQRQSAVPQVIALPVPVGLGKDMAKRPGPIYRCLHDRARATMRCLWIAGIFHPQPGGIPVYVDELTAALAGACDVGIVTEAGCRPPAGDRIAHFAIPNLARPATAEQWMRAARELRDVVAGFGPDAVHFSSACDAAYHWALPDSVFTVATVHGNDLSAPWQRTPGRDTTEVIVDGLNRCAHVFAVSGHTHGLARRWGVRGHMSIVTAGCDLEVFRPLPATVAATRRRYGLPADRPVVLTVGRHVPRKGHVRVLEALAGLAAPVHWLVVGRGPTRGALAEAIESSRMRGRVSLVGAVSKQELALLYNACDVFVLTPSTRIIGDGLDSEGFGLVYLEAAACGKPVIGSEAGGCGEAIVHGCTGFLVPPDDAGAIAEALGRLLGDAGLARQFGQSGRALVRASGGWRRLARETCDVYRTAPGSPPDGLTPSAARAPV